MHANVQVNLAKMSWFDTSGLANMAKSALKEAQKTIDKALDIKDEDVTDSSNPVDVNNEDFFSTWGINQPSTAAEKPPSEEIVTKSPSKNYKMPASIWGSFTGSFFETQNSAGQANQQQETTLTDSLIDDSIDLGNIDEKFKSSKLVVQASHDDSDYLKNAESTETLIDVDGDTGAQQQQLLPTNENVVMRDDKTNAGRRKDRTGSVYMNRLSVISSESGKNSSESVEIIGSTCGTECTTTPESEAFSQSISVSYSSKKDSDSVEVLPDSLTSPSSIEVLTDSLSNQQENVNSNRWSQLTENEFLSPLQSPTDNELTFLSAKSKDINTPDSIEVIQGDQEEEQSIADDTMSYTSLSESTSATVLDAAQNKKLKLKDMAESITSDMSLSPDKNVNFLGDPPITKGPSRSNLHLPLPIAIQPLGSLQNFTGSSFSNIIDIPEVEPDSQTQSEINDESSRSDRTLIGTDSETAVMESSSDTSTTTDSNSNSFYLKNMLADAMTDDVEKKFIVSCSSKQKEVASGSEELMLQNITISQLDMPPRETSPISSESRSDLVKIGSEQTSEHTSGDELETTASSDIEIISSPNGDSSSTQSRQSPAKLTIKNKGEQYVTSNLLGKSVTKKIKGHNRELSEASSHSDDSHSSEIDRLIKRLSDMTEILENRETKLIETSRKNAELQEVNVELRHQLDLLSKQLEIADLSQVTEEYTQRLSALEKKFQQAIREKDMLRKQLDLAKTEAAARMSKNELESLIKEKDETIKELREEGEKLSKQQLQHSNIIKKLRSKEKEHETSISHSKSRVEELSSETERLKRSLTAKEEVERSQIEAINQLTSKNKKYEYQISTLQSQIEDITQKYEVSKTSLEAAKKELQENTKTHSELLARERALTNLENEKKLTDSQNEEVINQLEDLRIKLRQSEQEYLKKEQILRMESSELLRRLEDAEARNEELTQSVSLATKPLVRQLEALQATYSMKTNAWEKQEQILLAKLGDAQGKISVMNETDRLSKEECIMLKSRLTSLETQLSSSLNQVELLKTQLEQQKTERALVEKELKRESEILQRKLNNETTVLENFKKNYHSLEQQISIEKAATEAEKRKNVILQEKIREKDTVASARASSGTTSPTLSLGRLSLSESLTSSNWAGDDPFEPASAIAPRFSNMFEVQSLHSSLKQKDDEVHQLQWELNRREQERSILNTEISNLITKLENTEQKLNDLQDVKVRFDDLQKKYDALCQMYGEKVEETEELKLDLQDVKEMYKTQIDELMKKTNK